jgi:hypothetical protein
LRISQYLTKTTPVPEDVKNSYLARAACSYLAKYREVPGSLVAKVFCVIADTARVVPGRHDDESTGNFIVDTCAVIM